MSNVMGTLAWQLTINTVCVCVYVHVLCPYVRNGLKLICSVDSICIIMLLLLYSEALTIDVNGANPC